ncbi:Uncharacterised protein [Enterobacter hormaechei]|nr:hypothetical protein AM451_06100 [Enterobacter cloacae complex sp.]KLF98732.1 hypothetical protein YA42_00660 [Enterobacter hormaechei subsp. oharae]TXV29980.1 hypothetical protein D4M74_17140 [Enterobacter hormaechei]CAF2585270.1 hypothetical protein AI2865V1_3034 [Enterobacter cloacae]KUQ73041.1 hypothetical protein AWI25_15955 [Enterobacter hormaechei subsp. oharae]
MDKCQGIFGKLFGHSYRPAITRGAPSSLKIGEVEGSSSAVIEVINSTRPETYHGIYCKRCGKVINGEV